MCITTITIVSPLHTDYDTESYDVMSLENLWWECVAYDTFQYYTYINFYIKIN